MYFRALLAVCWLQSNRGEQGERNLSEVVEKPGFRQLRLTGCALVFRR
jgi:hypothetical protein